MRLPWAVRRVIGKLTPSGIVAAACAVAVGLSVGGYFIGEGVYRSLARRTVTVKGLAERDVVADMAVWNLGVSKTGTDVAAMQKGVDADLAKIKLFLFKAGFADDEIQNGRARVRNEYTEKGQNQRYTIEAGVTVRSKKVTLVDAVSRRMGELIRQGIRVSDGYQGPTYAFRGLNDIKISMIEEATKNATEAGMQFAKDANAELGKIRDANQGFFSIEARDPTGGYYTGESEVINKKVRVVATITFYLK